MTSLDPVGVSAAAKALQEWTQTIRNLRATDERLREALAEIEAALREKALPFTDERLPTYVLGLPDVMNTLRAALAGVSAEAAAPASGDTKRERARIVKLLRDEAQATTFPKTADALDLAADLIEGSA